MCRLRSKHAHIQFARSLAAFVLLLAAPVGAQATEPAFTAGADYARKPALTGDEDLDAQRASAAMKENEESMQDFMKYRVQVAQARLPHTMLNPALATGDLVDLMTLPRKFTNDKGEKETIERDAAKNLWGPSDPADAVTPSDLWGLIEKLDQEDETFRHSLGGSAAATARE